MFGWLFSLPVARAQAPATGTITGRVFSPTNGEYLRNAEVSVKGTNLSTLSEATGEYRISNIPAGDATIVVKYTGYASSTATVTVIAGATVSQNFDLALPRGKSGDEGEPIKLDTFVISTEREGNAKAIQDQKQSMNVSNIVASETFGNVAEGNVGEFVKNLPGIQMDYVEADARSPRIRGLPAQFTTVTMDGMKMASADGFIQNTGTDNGGGGGAASRSFGFEQVSLSSVDSIEVNFTTNASQDADSPAGNINLRSAHAYQLKRQQITFGVSALMNSEELYFHRAVRLDSKSHSMIRPNASFTYANSFWDHRLGVRIGLSESNSFNEQRQFTPGYDATPTAADPRPLVITRLTYSDGPKITERSAFNLNLDFKVTEHL